MDQDENRFKFGENWANFLKVLSDERITQAESSLKNMLEVESLHGRTFLDIGSGSGLFSLCARRLGASVVSFDYDQNSVNCTKELKQRYFPDDPKWTVLQGSVLDKSFLSKLPSFDVVYAWGVLHHTGDMWTALGNVASLVNENGSLFLAIYNDQGRPSARWKIIKRLYHKIPAILQPVYVLAVMLWKFWFRFAVNPLKMLKTHIKNGRGMSLWHDWVDWVGGYPFEVATPGEIFIYFRNIGFTLSNISTANGWGNNEFVFKKGRAVVSPDSLAQQKA